MVQWVLALRYLRRRAVTLLALLSVAFGATAFIVVMGVMDGYLVEFERRCRDMLGDVVVSLPGQVIGAADMWVADLEAEPAVAGAAAYVRDYGVLKIPKPEGEEGKRFAIEWCHTIGVDPARHYGVVRPTMDPPLGPEDLPVPGEGRTNWVILGVDLMRSHDLHIGDEVWLVTSRQAGIDRVRKKWKLEVVGSLSFGIFEYDREVAYIHRDLAASIREFPPGAASEICVRFEDGVGPAVGLQEVWQAMGPTDEIRSYFDLSPFRENSNMLKAIESQRNLSRLILFFLFLVSGLAVVSVMFLVVLQKRHDIGVVRAIGLSSRGVLVTFLTYAGAIAVTGSVLGLLAGWGMLSRLDGVREFLKAQAGFDPFPAHLYHLDHIPWVIAPSTPIVIVLTAVVMSLLAGSLPALCASKVDPIESLRGE